MSINYDGRVFRSMANSDGVDVDGGTTFRYHQEGKLVWAIYAGGLILFGTLIAKVDGLGNLDIRYQHVATDGAFKSRRCQSTPELLSDGRLRVHEQWQWTHGAEGQGVSVIEEVLP